MNSRDRVLKAIRFEKPNKVPIGFNLTPSALLRHGHALFDLARNCPNDFYDVGEVLRMPERDDEHYRPDGTYYKEWTDEWGCFWVYFQEGISGEVKQSPLADWSNLKDYRFPPVLNTSPEERKQAMENMRQQKERFIGWGNGGCLWERMQWLRGVEDLMMDIALDVEEVYTLADLMLERHLIPNIELSLEAGAEVVGFADDWGTQTQLLINPQAWRRIFKPRYKRLFDIAHEGGALTWLHSDGMILEILPDLMEIGLDVINPQFSCMDLPALHRLTDHKLAIYTDIDRQFVLPGGTPQEIREYVAEVFRLFGSRDGGLMYGVGIYEDVPLENVSALFDALQEFRDLDGAR